jgi:hypothetical protein
MDSSKLERWLKVALLGTVHLNRAPHTSTEAVAESANTKSARAGVGRRPEEPPFCMGAAQVQFANGKPSRIGDPCSRPGSYEVEEDYQAALTLAAKVRK